MFKMRSKRKGAVVFLLSMLVLIFSMNVYPQEVSMEDVFNIFSESETVVTPARKETSIMKSPATISVITAEEIRRSGVINLPDLLRVIPGIDVLGIYGGASMVSTRGMQPFNSWKTAVLIDGQLIEPSFYGTLSWNQLPVLLDDIERIEIMRSPGVLYGANSLKGVVNIITKSPQDTKNRISGSVGDYDTHIGSLSHSGKLGKIAYRISGERFETDDWTKFREPASKRFDRSADQHISINSRIDYALNESSNLKFTFANNDYDFWNRIPDRLCESLMQGDIQYGRIAYHKELGDDSDLKVSLGRDFSTFKIVDNGAELTLRPDLEKSTHTLEFQHSFNVAESNNLLWGGEYKRESTDDIGLVKVMRDDVEEDLYALFFQDEYHPIENLLFYTGFRYDHHYISGNKFAPTASVVFEPIKNHSLRASVARAYRAPNIYETFMDYSPTTGTASKRGRYLGDDDNKAERIDSVELGYQNILFERVKGMVNLFWDKTTDVIEMRFIRNEVISGQTLPVFQFLNSGESRIKGVEVGAEFLVTEKFNTFLNYTFQNVDNKGIFPEHPNGRFGEGYAPENKINGGLTYSFREGIDLSLFFHFVDEVKWERPDWTSGTQTIQNFTTEPYYLWDLNIAYKSPAKNFEAGIGIFNLFDYRHTEWLVTHAGVLSRRAVAKLTYHF